MVYALAHATGKTGRFTLIERWRNNERLLAPQEHPLKVSELEGNKDISIKDVRIVERGWPRINTLWEVA